MLTNSQVRNFFDAYAMRMNSSIADGQINADEFAQCFASDFIGASPMGVQAGENNNAFRTVIRDGITFYRKVGVRSMVIDRQETWLLNESHALAKVQWRCTYERDKSGEIPFVTYYLVQSLGNLIKIFSYITDDETKAFKENGLL